jgi:hypothetical protein
MLQQDLRLFRLLNALWRLWHTLQNGYLRTAEKLRRRGILCRLLPASLAPRVVSTVEGDRMYFDLWIGKRRVGNYDIHQRRWQILSPYHWFINMEALPGEDVSDPVQALLALRKSSAPLN